MKIIQIVPPQRGSVQRIALDGKSVLSLTFELSSVETLKEGNDLLFIFSDGSIVLLENYFQVEVSPTFLLANGEVLQTFEEMLAFSAKAETVLQEVALAENETSDLSALNVNVAAGGAQNGGSGIGEFRDSDGAISGAIERLPLGNEGQIGTGNGIGGNTAPGLGIPPTGGIGTDVPVPPPVTVLPSPVPGWSEVTKDPVTGGMKDPTEMFPNLGVVLPEGVSAKSVVITLNNFCFAGGDKIFLGEIELDMTKNPVVDMNGNPIPGIDIGYANGKLTITKTDGTPLSQDELNSLLDSFKFQNNGIGSDSSFDTGYRDVDIEIKDEHGANITPEGNGDKDFIDADLEFRVKSEISGDVTVKAGDNDIFVNGSRGDDTITVIGSTTGGKHHLIVGGGGNDSIQGAMEDYNLILGDGEWVGGCTVDPSKGIGNDTLTGGNKADVIIGGAGTDSIDGGAGNDILVGGALESADLKILQEILAGMGKEKPTNDILKKWFDTLQAVSAKDTEADTIRGGAGNDLIIGGSGDSIDTGAGNDLIYVSGGNNTINAEDGNDTIFGSAGDDTINGGTGNDLIYASAGKNSIDGGDGNDTIFGGTGNDTINGGAGDDLVYTGGGTNIIINHPQEGNDAFILNNDNKTIIQGGLDGDRVLTNGMGGDTFTIAGNVSNSTITLGEGADKVTVSGDISGNTKIDLGAGNDIISVTGGMTGGTINAGLGSDFIRINRDVSNSTITLGGEDTANNTLYIDGNVSGDTSIAGGKADDAIYIGGMNGGIIEAGEGKDDIYADSISGGTINAGAGNDTIAIGRPPHLQPNLDMNVVTGGTIDGGLGNDVIEINGSMSGGTIDAGDGEDKLSISGNISGGTINTGKGSDTLTIGKNITGNATIILGTESENEKDILDIQGSVTGGNVSMGGGDDEVTIAGDISGGNIDLGTGKDTITVVGSVGGNGTIDAGDGENVVSVGGGMSGGDITTGKDKDAITITGDMTGGKIDTGADSDAILISGSMTGGTIETGEGDDFLRILNNLEGNGTIDAGDGKNMVSIGGGMSGGSIATGKDNDNVLVVGALSGGVVTAGDGQNTVSVGGVMSGGSITTGKDSDTIAIVGGMNNGTIESGDGADSIDIGNHATDIPGGGTSTVPVMSGGTVNGGLGNDTITIHGSMEGGTVNGGLGDDSVTIHGNLAGGTVDLSEGQDTLVISGAVTGGEIIFGDADNKLELENGITGNVTIDMGKGNDTIELGICKDDAVTPPNTTDIMTGGSILLGEGNDQAILHGNMIGGTIDGGVGNDTIWIHGSVAGNASINLGTGSDEVVLAEGIAGNATIILGAENENENDALWIHGSVSGGNVSMGGGDDRVGIKGDMSAGTINLGTGNDTLYTDGTMSGGMIDAGAGKDSITIATMSGGTVNAGIGNDTINVTTMSSGSIFADEGNDVIDIKNLSGNSTVDAGSGADRIFVGTMSGGSIFAGTDKDQVNITNLVTGRVDLGEGDDTINISSMSGNSDVEAGDGNDSIQIIDIQGGTISGGAGNDTIIIHKMGGGSIDAGAGDDKIIISSEDGNFFHAGSAVAGGEGTDTLVLNTTGDGIVKDLTLDKIPQLNGVECVDIGGSKLVLGDGNLSNVLGGNNNTVTFLINDWGQVTFELGSGWVKNPDNSYTNGDYTIKFEGQNGGTIVGEAPNPGAEITVAEEAVTQLLTPLLADDKHSAEQRSATESAIATIVALAMAGATELHAEEAFSLGEEEKTVVSAESTASFSDVLAMEKEQHIDTTPLANGAPLEVVANPIQYSIPENDDILAGIEANKEEIAIIAEESTIENSVVVDERTVHEAVDNSAVMEGVPVQNIEEGIVESEAQESEELLEEVVAETVETLPVYLEDIIANESYDLPREEVESLEGIYGTAEVNDWYTMNTVAVSHETGNNDIDNVDKGMQIADTAHTDAVGVDCCFAAFEFVEPSMELQYDEQIF